MKPNGRRGRLKKGAEPKDTQQSVSERQLAQSAEQAVGELNALCNWGCNCDNQAPIPLERMTCEQVVHLYSLMDSVYDAGPIKDFLVASGRIPIIDPNKRRKEQRIVSHQKTTVQDTLHRQTLQFPSEGLADSSKFRAQGPDKVATA